MEQVAFISIRQRGQNFGKPVAAESVMKEYVFDEIKVMHEKDAIRFYSEDGDTLDAKGALLFLKDFSISSAFVKCRTRDDYTKFIEEHGAQTELGKTALMKIEEMIFDEAQTEEDYKKFLMRFPNSPLAEQAKEKCGYSNLDKRILVVSSLDMINANDNLMQNLQEKNYTGVSTAVFNDPQAFDDHVRRNDVLLVVVDDRHYVDILTLFTYCLEYRKEMILVYEEGLELRKMTMKDVDSALIALQTNASNEHFGDLIRDIRLNVPGFVKKVSALKKLKTNRIEALAACLN